MVVKRYIQSFIFISWLSTVLATTRPPSISTMPDQDIYYRAGETVVMPCVAKGDPQPKYRWQKNKQGFLVSSHEDRMVQLTNNGTIIINRTEDTDEGIYQCFADNEYGVSAASNIHLRLAALSPFRSRPDKDVKHYPTLGDALTLNCILPYSVPSAEFAWVVEDRAEKFVPINDSARVIIDHEGRLRFANIINVDANHGRGYVCMARNPILRSVVLDIPHVIIPNGISPRLNVVYLVWASPSYQDGFRGEKFKLMCIFSGNPTPEVHWERTGGELPKGVKLFSFGQELVFDSLKESDAGEYKCYATNSLGPRPVSRTFQVSVKSRPYWRDQPKDVEIEEGGTARFTCDAGGDPKPFVKWYVNSIPYASNTDPRLKKFRVVQTDTVEMINVNRDDAMVIQCNVSNKFGYLWGDSYLNVLAETPVILTLPGIIKTAEGLSVNISCRHTGKPDPQVAWFIGDHKIFNGGRYQTQLNGDLLIKNVVLNDAGVYRCTVENSYGEVSASGVLIVREKTVITQAPVDLQVDAGTDAKFTCAGITDPEEVDKLEILWEKDNKSINTGDQRVHVTRKDNSLIISGAISQDSGTYTCIATDGIDSSRKSATLLVKVDRPPGIYLQSAKEIYYTAGEPVVLFCEAKGEPQPRYRWQKNKQGFLVSCHDDRMTQLPNVGTFMINRTEDTDEGIYQCFADNEYGVSVSTYIHLRLAKLLLFDLTFRRNENVKHYPTLGDALTLNCVLPPSVPSADFGWGMEDRAERFVPINDSARVTVDHEGRLRFANIINDDANYGRGYACMARNPQLRSVVLDIPHYIIPIGTSSRLNVVKNVWSSNSEQVGLRGNEFKIKCIFSGNPTPDVHWDRTGRELPEGVKLQSYGQELVFVSLKESDAGEYKCFATNSLNPRPVSRTFKVIVKSRPYWKNKPKDVEIEEGGTARFMCDAGGDPKPSVKWYVNSIPYTSNTDPRLKKFTVVQTDTVEMVNVSRDDSMVIQCNVSNTYGYLLGESYLNVVAEAGEAPFIFTPPKNTVASEGQTIIIFCGHTGKPDPQVTWFIGDEKIVDGGRFLKQRTGDLIIQNVALSDAGVYRCEVENSYGKVSASGVVIVRMKTDPAAV